MAARLDNYFYYLDNFHMVLDWVAARYADLLDPLETSFIATFRSQPRAAQALLVRMVMRKGELFRASKLAYAEIGDTASAAAPLLANGWIKDEPDLSLAQLFGLFTKPELIRLFAVPRPLANASKGEILLALQSGLPDAGYVQSLHAWRESSSMPGGSAQAESGKTAPSQTRARPATSTTQATDAGQATETELLPEPVYHLQIANLCDRLRLMFFGNLHQDWTEFVLSDLGIYQFEKVAITIEARGFRTRFDLEHYQQLFYLRECWQQGEAAETVLARLAQLPLSSQSWLEQRRSRLQFQIGQQYEREQQWEAALALYQNNPAPEARLRWLRVLLRTGQLASACALALEMAAHPAHEAEYQQLLRIVPRLLGKLKKSAHGPAPLTQQAQLTQLAALTGSGAPHASATEELHLPLPAPAANNPYSVEQLAAQALQQADGPVYYVENTLLNSLFGLLCWEAIFCALPGAFFHPYQRGPVDLHSADFYPRRQAVFDACLAQLESDAWQTTIRHHFHIKNGLQSPFVFWQILSEELLDLALQCLPPPHLRVLFLRILADIASNRSGLPDLIQFWPQQRRYRMIEVKGPGDRLQDNQLRWLDHFAQHGIPVQVCYVSYQAPS